MRKPQLIRFAIYAFACCAAISTAKAQWKSQQTIPGFTTGRWGAMSFTLNNKIYVAGGYVGNFQNYKDLNVYDPATGNWMTKKDLPGTYTSRTGGVSFVLNGKAYIGLGAQDYNNFNPMPLYLKDLWEYDEAGDKWTKKADLPANGIADAGVFVVNNKAYIIGGAQDNTGNNTTNKVWEYDAVANKWTAKKAYPGADGIQHPMAFSLNGKGYVTCGAASIGSSAANTNKTFEYNPSSDTWSAKKEFPSDTGRRGGVSFVINNKAYCGLGGTYSTYPNNFYTYDVANDSWHYLTGGEFLNKGRMFGIAAVANNKAYVGAGWRLDGGATQTFFRDWYELEPNSLLSVDELAAKGKILCYPNPATDVLYVESNTANQPYTLYNLAGQSVLSGTCTTGSPIHIGQLPAGQYVLEIITPNETLHSRVCIQPHG